MDWLGQSGCGKGLSRYWLVGKWVVESKVAQSLQGTKLADKMVRMMSNELGMVMGSVQGVKGK